MASAQEQLQRPDYDVSHHLEEDEIHVDGHEFVPDAVDPGYDAQTPSSFTTSKNLKDEDDQAKDEAEKAEKAKNDATRDAMRKLKSSILVSGAIVAGIGAILAVAKKIKEA